MIMRIGSLENVTVHCYMRAHIVVERKGYLYFKYMAYEFQSEDHAEIIINGN